MSGSKVVIDKFPDPEVVARYQGRQLDTMELCEILPHRPPMLLVDRIIELVPGERAVGVKGITVGEPYFAGHFPSQPVMPGVLILEAMAQVSGVVLLTGLDRGNLLPFFAGVKEARFREPVMPGCLLRLEAEAKRVNIRFGRLISWLEMRALVDDKLVAEATCSFALVSPD